jgi:hypothetical protein
MLSRVSINREYGVPLKTFEQAAALNDLELHKNKIDAIFQAIDLVIVGTKFIGL